MLAEGLLSFSFASGDNLLCKYVICTSDFQYKKIFFTKNRRCVYDIVMPKKLELVFVRTQAELNIIRQERGCIRIGTTTNPEARASAYASEGYRGTMYVTETKNMMKCEDRFLRDHLPRHNVHTFSNHGDYEGYIYAIIGRKIIVE